MPDQPNDPIAALITYLKADAGVSALVGDLVWGGRVPEEAAMPQASVLIRPNGGGGLGQSGQNVAAIRVMVESYGKTPTEAWAVHLAVRKAMLAMLRDSLAGVLLHRAFVSSDGISVLDPATDPPWPLTMTNYQVVVSDLGE